MSDKRVTDVQPIRGESVSVQGDFYTDHRRYGPDDWEVRMGESWETVFNPEDLEALYQVYIRARPSDA